MLIQTDHLERLTAGNPEPPAYGRAPRHAMLVVEDDPVQARVIARRLEAAGAVYVANDADSALQLLEEHDDIAVLITDLRMPGHDGEWLIDHARSRHPPIKVVCMSAYFTNLERIKAKVDAVFEKPFPLQELAITVSLLAIEVGLP